MTETTTKRLGKSALVAALAVFVLTVLIVSLIIGGTSNPDAAAALPKPGKSTAATPTPSPSATGSCKAEFTQESITHEGNKVDDKFYEKYTTAIANVTNLSEAQRDLFIAESAKDAKKLAIWSGLVNLHGNQNDWKSLVNEDSTCLNEAGQELWYTLKGAVSAKGVKFEEAQAPESWWNSGMHGDTYGTSATQGIYGDRTAIKITLTDGTVAYILVRCGNPAYPGKPSLPDVPTDNPPPPTPETPIWKDSPTKDPYVQGNAPQGGGKNADPGPGVYVPPAQMEQPPAAPYVPPAPPAPQPPAPEPATPSNPNPAPVPTKDPAPAPAPRPSAPPPSAPETVCDASAPGADC